MRTSWFVGESQSFSIRRCLPATVLFLAVLMLLLAGCGGGDENAAAPEVPPESNLADNQLRLVCDDRCAERAQCGTAQDGSPVVFLKRDNPDVSNQDLAIPAGSVGTVLETQASQVTELSTGTEFTTTFFKLLLSDQVTQGWVPEWCIGR